MNYLRIWKNNALFNLISREIDIDKIYLYAKGPYEAKYQLLIIKRENSNLNRFNYSKAFIEYSMISMIFIKVLKNAIQINNAKRLFLII